MEWADLRTMPGEVERLREENARLTQRVDELEAHWRDFMRWDESAVMYDWKGRAEAAEAKLAKLEELHSKLRHEANRIQELEAELARTEEMRQQNADHLERAEAKLAKVLEALHILQRHDPPLNHEIMALLNATLAAAKGEAA